MKQIIKINWLMHDHMETKNNPKIILKHKQRFTFTTQLLLGSVI